MTNKEILERNVKYLGDYLFNYANPEPTKWFTQNQAKKLDEGMYRRQIEVLYEHGVIEEQTYYDMLALLAKQLVIESTEEAEDVIRNLLLPVVK